MYRFIIFAILSFFSITAQGYYRAHGLDSESQIALSPEAVTFFHPEALQPSANNRARADGPSLPLAATVQSTPAHESTSAPRNKGMEEGAIVAIPLGFTFVCLMAMGVYYVVIKREANLKRANPVYHAQTA